MGPAARPGVEHGCATLILRGLSPEHRPSLGLLSKSLRELHPTRVTVSGRLTIRAKARANKPMIETINWETITHYAGFDWAKDHHDVVIVDQQGKIVKDL